MRPHQRQVREGEGGEDAEAEGGGERAPLHRRRQFDAEDIAEDRQGRGSEGGADHEADDDTDQRQQAHLREEMDEDARPGGAQAAQRGDGALPLLDIGGDGVGDADAAHQQRA